MLKDKAPTRRGLSASLQAAVLAATLLMFLLLHVLAGAILHRAGTADGPPSRQGLALQPYD